MSVWSRLLILQSNRRIRNIARCSSTVSVVVSSVLTAYRKAPSVCERLAHQQLPHGAGEQHRANAHHKAHSIERVNDFALACS